MGVCEDLHGSNAVASLKQDTSYILTWQFDDLHGSNAVASLKRYYLTDTLGPFS